MITETIFAGRNNTFSLQLVRGGEAVNLLSITGYELVLSEDPDLRFQDVNQSTFDEGIFIEKGNGVVEINIGTRLTEDNVGKYKAYLVTYDPVNLNGVRWPPFYLKVV
jgi:hypothetical protein